MPRTSRSSRVLFHAVSAPVPSRPFLCCREAFSAGFRQLCWEPRLRHGFVMLGTRWVPWTRNCAVAWFCGMGIQLCAAAADFALITVSEDCWGRVGVFTWKRCADFE